VPTGERQPAGLVVSCGDDCLLLDSGSGTIARLGRMGVDYRTLRTAVYTHAHADHTLDLVALIHALNFTPGFRRDTALEVIGPSGFGEFLGRLEAAYPSLKLRDYEIRVTELQRAAHDLGWARLHSACVPHGNTAANAYRIETDEAIVVVSGDCAPSDALVDLALGADLLLSEASFTRKVPEACHHLTTQEAAALAQRAGVPRLVLTHFYPRAGEHDVAADCAGLYAGEVIEARDNLVLEIRRGRMATVWDYV
jgi:ribonuclease BN (tRNA processing enzyme)